MSAGPLQPGPWLDDGVVVADTGNVISSLPLHGRDLLEGHMASYLGRRKFLARLAARAVTATGEEDRADGDARPSQL
jgi:hypothetical protein